jgi:hypothetical protein
LVGAIPGLFGLVRASSGTLNPPHTDVGLDTSFPPNGLYDELIINISVDVTAAGMFFMFVDMYDNSGSFWIDGQFNLVNLVTTGVQYVNFSFPGYTIRSSGYDGPYWVDIMLLDETFILLDTGVHMTNPYLATNFDFPPAVFNPPHSDVGIDTDADTLYDFLVVSANITVNTTGDYSVQGELYDNTGVFFIDSTSNGSSFSTGNHMIDLSFTGFIIRGSGFDGPYRVELYLLDNMMNLLDNDTHFTNPYLFTDFDLPPAQFEPPHSDYGLDVNGNLLYEYLIVSAEVNVSTDGSYEVQGMAPFGFTQNTSFFTAGIHTVDLRFYGFEIFNFGINGPYSIDLQVRDDSFNLLDTDTHSTAAYAFTDFETNPPIVFSPPHSDYGLDMDGDMTFDFLVVNASVNVSISGFYEISADLWDNTGMWFIDAQMNSTWLNSGIQTVEIRFSGPAIFASGFDGPYMVNMFAGDGIGWTFDMDTYFTNAYLFSDFDEPGASFFPPHSDYGLDTSFPPDGIYEVLVVNASVMVNNPGVYFIQAILFDPFLNPISMVQTSANLSIGPGVIPLEFSGIDINRNGENGTFAAMMFLFEIGPTGPTEIDNDLHFTNMYNYTDFVSLPLSLIWGYMYDGSTGMPVNGGEVFVVNYSYAWMMNALTNPSGYYEFPAFDGEFYVMMDDTNLQANLSVVQVIGDTEVTRTLGTPPPTNLNTHLTFTDWDNGYANTTGMMADDNQSIRFMIDWMYGNRDAYLNQSEADFWLFMMGGPGGPPSMTDTIDMLYVDGIHYDQVPGTDTFIFDITGPVSSASPFMMNVGGNYTSNSTIPVSNIHRMEVNNTYDTIDERSIFSGQVPAGFNLWGYDPVANVSVTGIGTPNFVTDPLMDPNPMDTIDWVWTNLTFGLGAPDTTAPQTLSVTINGQISPTYGMSAIPPVLYINATIDDMATGDVPIGGANFTEGPKNWALSWPMNATDGTFDTSVEDVTGTIVSPPFGMTQYCVYGWDVVPNFATTDVCTSLTITDDIKPQIDSVLMDGAPTSTFFLSTLPAIASLTAIINESSAGDSDIGGANYTTPLIDSWPGIDMNPTDGNFDGPVEDVNVGVPVPWLSGTFDYFVHAWDVNGNYNDTSPAVQIIVVDDIDPAVTNVLLNGMPSISVMPGTPVTVEAIIDDTSGRGDSLVDGANYTIDGDWLTSTALNPTDGAFDGVSEAVTSAPGTIDTTTWPDAVYLVCVYGWDNLPNYNMTGACASLTIASVDNEPPLVYGVTLNDLPSITVAPGSVVFLNATIDDLPALGSNIQGANYSIDGAWNDANVLYPMDGAFDGPQEDVNTTISTAGWPDGTYNICVSGWDDVPNYNSSFFVMACAQLTIFSPGDTQPPLITNVLLDSQAGPLTVVQGATVTLTATIDDSTTGGSDILDASYTVNMTGPNMVMFPTDDFFDSDVEPVNVSINTSGWADSTYTICVHGSDIVPNQHSAFDACIQLIVQILPDTTPPTISNVLADPDPAAPGENVRISATVDDDVGVSEVRIKIWNPSGSEVASAPMSYDSGNDEYYYSYADNNEGTYTFEINATDTSSNSAVETGDYDVHEQTPPTIDVTVSDENPEVGDTVTFEADVTDDSDIDSVRITIEDSDGNTVVNRAHMIEDGGVYVYEYEVDEAGDFTYTITATDEHDNSDDASGTFSASEPAAPSFFEDYWWLILLIVIIVVVLLLVGLMMRKPKVEEAAPVTEMEAPPSEEPVEPPMEEPVEEFVEEPPEEPEEPPIEEMPEEPPPPDDVGEGETLDELEE